MKTEVWVYTVQEVMGDILWQGVFDCEISDARALKEYREEIPTDNISEVIVRCAKRTLFQESRNPVSAVPEIASGILFALEKDLLEPGWFKDLTVKLSLDQPIVFEYLSTVIQRHGEVAGFIGCVIYRLIESQIEAQEI